MKSRNQISKPPDELQARKLTLNAKSTITSGAEPSMDRTYQDRLWVKQLAESMEVATPPVPDAPDEPSNRQLKTLDPALLISDSPYQPIISLEPHSLTQREFMKMNQNDARETQESIFDQSFNEPANPLKRNSKPFQGNVLLRHCENENFLQKTMKKKDVQEVVGRRLPDSAIPLVKEGGSDVKRPESRSVTQNSAKQKIVPLSQYFNHDENSIVHLLTSRDPNLSNGGGSSRFQADPNGLSQLVQSAVRSKEQTLSQEGDTERHLYQVEESKQSKQGTPGTRYPTSRLTKTQLARGSPGNPVNFDSKTLQKGIQVRPMLVKHRLQSKSSTRETPSGKPSYPDNTGDHVIFSQINHQDLSQEDALNSVEDTISQHPYRQTDLEATPEPVQKRTPVTGTRDSGKARKSISQQNISGKNGIKIRSAGKNKENSGFVEGKLPLPRVGYSLSNLGFQYEKHLSSILDDDNFILSKEFLQENSFIQQISRLGKGAEFSGIQQKREPVDASSPPRASHKKKSSYQQIHAELMARIKQSDSDLEETVPTICHGQSPDVEVRDRMAERVQTRESGSRNGFREVEANPTTKYVDGTVGGINQSESLIEMQEMEIRQGYSQSPVKGRQGRNAGSRKNSAGVDGGSKVRMVKHDSNLPAYTQGIKELKIQSFKQPKTESGVQNQPDYVMLLPQHTRLENTTDLIEDINLQASGSGLYQNEKTIVGNYSIVNKFKANKMRSENPEKVPFGQRSLSHAAKTFHPRKQSSFGGEKTKSAQDLQMKASAATSYYLPKPSKYLGSESAKLTHYLVQKSLDGGGAEGVSMLKSHMKNFMSEQELRNVQSQQNYDKYMQKLNLKNKKAQKLSQPVSQNRQIRLAQTSYGTRAKIAQNSQNSIRPSTSDNTSSLKNLKMGRKSSVKSKYNKIVKIGKHERFQVPYQQMPVRESQLSRGSERTRNQEYAKSFSISNINQNGMKQKISIPVHNNADQYAMSSQSSLYWNPKMGTNFQNSTVNSKPDMPTHQKQESRVVQKGKGAIESPVKLEQDNELASEYLESYREQPYIKLTAKVKGSQKRKRKFAKGIMKRKFGKYSKSKTGCGHRGSFGNGTNNTLVAGGTDIPNTHNAGYTQTVGGGIGSDLAKKPSKLSQWRKAILKSDQMRHQTGNIKPMAGQRSNSYISQNRAQSIPSYKIGGNQLNTEIIFGKQLQTKKVIRSGPTRRGVNVTKMQGYKKNRLKTLQGAQVIQNSQGPYKNSDLQNFDSLQLTKSRSDITVEDPKLNLGEVRYDPPNRAGIFDQENDKPVAHEQKQLISPREFLVSEKTDQTAPENRNIDEQNLGAQLGSELEILKSQNLKSSRIKINTYEHEQAHLGRNFTEDFGVQSQPTNESQEPLIRKPRQSQDSQASQFSQISDQVKVDEITLNSAEKSYKIHHGEEIVVSPPNKNNYSNMSEIESEQ